jgi:hypothetical protein
VSHLYNLDRFKRCQMLKVLLAITVIDGVGHAAVVPTVGFFVAGLKK